MKAEKIVKLQARKNLSNNNWSTAIGCFAVTLIFAFLILFLYYCLLYGFDTVNIQTNQFKENKATLVNLLQIGTIILFILASPVFSGYTKVCYNIAKYERTTTYDLFFYFTRPKLYFKALGVNILKGIFLFPTLALGLLGYAFIFNGIYSGDLSNNLYTLILGISISVFDIILFLVLCAKLSFVNNILAESPYNSIFFYISESFSISKGHTISTIKLILSFTLWYALCFFVLPVFYVVPYAKVAKCTSAKWLIKIRKEEFR